MIIAQSRQARVRPCLVAVRSSRISRPCFRRSRRRSISECCATGARIGSPRFVNRCIRKTGVGPIRSAIVLTARPLTPAVRSPLFQIGPGDVDASRGLAPEGHLPCKTSVVPAAHRCPERQDAAATVLDLLIAHHPGLLHVDELVWLYAGGSIEHSEARSIIDDAVSELLASGLIHRLERFVFVSRGALRAQQLVR